MLCPPEPQQPVWIDGEFVPWSEAKMHVSSHHYGFGVFEGVRAYATDAGCSIFRLQDHTRRLFRSAHIMRIRVPGGLDCDRLNSVQLELLRRSGLRDAYLRPFVFYDGFVGLRPSTQDLSVRVAVLALAWKSRAEPADGARLGLTLRTASFARQPPNSVLSKAKANANYVGAMLSLQEAQASGADDVLVLDQSGFATETSGANLFVVRNGSLLTPPLASVLDGVTRDTVMELARAGGLDVSERQIPRDEIYVADEVFVTGTASEVTPVLELDGRRIGSGARGPLTERLQAMYVSHVHGRGEHRKEWLTPT